MRDALGDNSGVSDMMGQLAGGTSGGTSGGTAGGLVDIYFGAMMNVMGVLAAAFAVQTLLRLRSEETGGAAGREDVAGLLFLNVPQQDVTIMLGRPVDWQPRENRALLYDRQADRLVKLVPFVDPEGTPA